MDDSSKYFDFADKLLSIKNRAQQSLSKEDYYHLRKIIWLNRSLFIVGIGTAWILPNIISMLCISIALHGKWTVVGHHVCHGGYDKIPGIPSRYHSKNFAMGWRRFIDWLDWMYPPAWKYEHNILHHFHTNESLDPDLVSLHVRNSFKPSWSTWVKFIVLVFYMSVWKAAYYSPNTLKAYCERKSYDSSKSLTAYLFMALTYNYIPYISINFLLIPLCFFPLGWTAIVFVFINRLGAEIFTNIHSFLTIVPNHTGEDILVPDRHFKNRGEFFVNQINSTCNYQTGGFLRDYLQGYLNYQIEHHLFPDLPPSQYVKLQPLIKNLCHEYGITYKQESIFKRIKKTLVTMHSHSLNIPKDENKKEYKKIYYDI